MHYYKRHIGDYAKKAGRLSLLEHGAYTLLIDACYDRERFPTMDEAIEWAWARTDDEREAVRFVLARFFDLQDGLYVQKRIAEEVAAYHATSEINRRIATQREEKRREKARSVHGASPHDHGAPPNHEPLTTNHEPVDKESTSAAKLPTCKASAVIDLYHEILPELPSVRLETADRKRAIRKLWQWVLTSRKSDGTRRAESAEDALQWVRGYFARARENDFLMGRIARVGDHANWRCDLDFLLTDKGMKHVIEKTLEAA